mgnify:CR=1 FL=1
MNKEITLPMLGENQSPKETGFSNPYFSITDSARAKIKEVLDTDQWVRVSIEGGGCTGMKYRFDLIQKTDIEQDDLIFQDDLVVVDPISLNYIQGATLDYVSDFASSFFSFQNPNATAKCGCGSSFAV